MRRVAAQPLDTRLEDLGRYRAVDRVEFRRRVVIGVGTQVHSIQVRMHG